MRNLARQHTKEAIERLVEWMRSKDPKASPFAAKELLNRGWGQAPQYHEHDGDIRQHINSDCPMTADEWVANYCSGKRRKARAYTRNGFDWSESYLAITKAGAKLDCRSAIIDGEVIVQDKRGVSDFATLKSAIRWRPQSLIFCAFDLLHLNGKDLRDGPLVERRAKLRELVPSEHPFLFSEEFTGDADAFFQACADHQLEGIVSKLA
jgi:hypothetical protein